VHVSVGPVASESAKAWLGYAREVLSWRRAPGGSEIPDELRDAFGSYLTEWEKVASAGDEFRWETDVSPELVEYLVHGFFRVAAHLADEAEARGSRLLPEEGDAFYAALVRGLLDALTEESPATAEFAAYLRSFWPGFETRPSGQ
jgi:hypothetical protein